MDFIFLDMTNGATYPDALVALCDTWLEMRHEGIATPDICVFTNEKTDADMASLRGNIYSDAGWEKYSELFYVYKGKPLILANRTNCSAETRAFLDEKFTVRNCWAWRDEPGSWSWLQEYRIVDGKVQLVNGGPGTNADGEFEQLALCVGHHPTTNKGRSYANTVFPQVNDDFGFSLDSGAGAGFEAQFEAVMKLDPDMVMITGWNEWYAGVQKTGNQEQTCGGTLTPGYYMVEQMSPEYSRDGEPMRLRDGVGFGDNYYYQMVSYIRKFKGIHAPATVNGGTMDIHAADIAAQWKDVTPLFTDTVGDANLRSELSWASEFRYTNASARNDIACAQVSQDADKVYFFVTTANALITADDETWMNLYLNTDGDSKTGWEGYDFILNRSRTDKTVSIERFVDGKWQFEKVGEAEYALCENGLMLAVSKTLIGGESGKALSLTFKWADHADIRGDVMRFMELGDTAPNDRFAFAYNASGLTDERTAEPGTETGTGAETDTATEPSTTEAPAETTGAETEAGKTGCSSAISAVVPAMLASAGAALAVSGSAQRRRKRRME